MWYFLAKQADGGYRDYVPESNMRTKNVTTEMVNKMYDAHKKGLSIDEVARQFGYDHNALRRQFNEQGLQTQNVDPVSGYIEKAKYMIIHQRGLCENIVKMFENGESIQSISANPNIKLPATTVFEIIKDLKGANKKNDLKTKPQDIEAAVALFRKGKTPNFIARQTGISPQAIIKHILKKVTPEEREAYRNKVRSRNDSEFNQKVDTVLRFIKENPEAKMRHLVKALGMNGMSIQHIKDIFLDSNE